MNMSRTKGFIIQQEEKDESSPEKLTGEPAGTYTFKPSEPQHWYEGETIPDEWEIAHETVQMKDLKYTLIFKEVIINKKRRHEMEVYATDDKRIWNIKPSEIHTVEFTKGNYNTKREIKISFTRAVKGEVYECELPTVNTKNQGEYDEILEWLDKVNRLPLKRYDAHKTKNIYKAVSFPLDSTAAIYQKHIKLKASDENLGEIGSMDIRFTYNNELEVYVHDGTLPLQVYKVGYIKKDWVFYYYGDNGEKRDLTRLRFDNETTRNLLGNLEEFAKIGSLKDLSQKQSRCFQLNVDGGSQEDDDSSNDIPGNEPELPDLQAPMGPPPKNISGKMLPPKFDKTAPKAKKEHSEVEEQKSTDVTESLLNLGTTDNAQKLEEIGKSMSSLPKAPKPKELEQKPHGLPRNRRSKKKRRVPPAPAPRKSVPPPPKKSVPPPPPPQVPVKPEAEKKVLPPPPAHEDIPAERPHDLHAKQPKLEEQPNGECHYMEENNSDTGTDDSPSHNNTQTIDNNENHDIDEAVKCVNGLGLGPEQLAELIKTLQSQLPNRRLAADDSTADNMFSFMYFLPLLLLLVLIFKRFSNSCFKNDEENENDHQDAEVSENIV